MTLDDKLGDQQSNYNNSWGLHICVSQIWWQPLGFTLWIDGYLYLISWQAIQQLRYFTQNHKSEVDQNHEDTLCGSYECPLKI